MAGQLLLLAIAPNLLPVVHRTSSCPQRIFVVSIQLLQLRRMSLQIISNLVIRWNCNCAYVYVALIVLVFLVAREFLCMTS